MITQYTILDMIPGIGKPTVNVSQYDTGARTLVFQLRERGKIFTPPAGTVAKIHGIKPDSTYFAYAAEVDGDAVIADCKEQMTPLAGLVTCEIVLTDSDGKVGSCNFILNVEKSPETGAIISDTDIPVFEQLATRAEQAASSATASATAAAESAEQAGTSATNAGESADRAAREAETASQAAEEAGESATAAAESASSASDSEASARGFAEQAEQFAGEASESAQGATQASQTASAKASEAAASADRASGSAVDSANAANLASGYADTAQAQAQAAGASATNAAGSASTASQAAATATTKAGEASQSATAAGTSASQAAASATAANTSAENASASASAAATSAGSASDSATAAAASASTATEKATEAAGSASEARASATAAADLVGSNTASIFAVNVGMERGYWAIADGSAVSSPTWCRTKTFVPREYILSTTNITMCLCAYNKRSGAYIGTWNGTEFVTTFTAGSMLKKLFSIYEFTKKYTDYAFKVDFFGNSRTLPVDTVINDLVVTSIIDGLQAKTCRNLVGNVFEKLYPVTLAEGMYLTISTSDGLQNGVQTNIWFYDKYGNEISYYGFPSGNAVRTIGPLTAEMGSAKYLALRNTAPRVPLMVNVGSSAYPYEEYFLPIPDITEKVLDMPSISDVANIHKEDKNAVYALKRHFGTNASSDNGFKALWVSDIHAEKTRAARMVELLNAWGTSYFDVAINTGDTVSTLYSQDISWYDDLVSDSDIPILNTVGNHDALTNLSGTLANKTDVYNKFIAPVASSASIVQPTGASTNGLNYYYKDVGGVRVIVLDCMYWDSNELTWFENALADALSEGLPVIACSHAPFNSTYCELLDSVWNVGWFHRDSTETNIAAAGAVKTFIDGGGTFICWLIGHIHGDEIETLPDYGDQLVICTNTFQDRGTTVVKNTDPMAYNYDSLTYITVDTVNTSVKMYRIGANIDTAGHKRNGFVWDYSIGKIVTEW